MVDRLKPVYKTETPGPWIYDPGDPGYPDSRWEPGDPGYAPCIYAKPPEGYGYDEDEETHQAKIAELFLPVLPDLEPDPEAYETYICWGNANVNGKLMAAAPEMWKFLQELANGPEGELSSRIIPWVLAFEKELEKK